MLEVKHLNVYYGESHVVRDVSLELGDSETMAVMGRNGMGKSTLLKAMIGVIPARSGAIRLGEAELQETKSYQRVAAGMAYVPQGRMIFSHLTVEENIIAGMETSESDEIPGYVYQTFPVLKDMRKRKGGNLSGGQQQQLAIARALVANPKVLLLDEPTEGIQPSIIKDLARALNDLKRDRKFSLLVSEQVLSFALEIADRFLIIDKGEFVHEEYRESVDSEKIRSYLTI